jgi:hypothetical protein
MDFPLELWLMVFRQLTTPEAQIRLRLLGWTPPWTQFFEGLLLTTRRNMLVSAIQGNCVSLFELLVTHAPSRGMYAFATVITCLRENRFQILERAVELIPGLESEFWMYDDSFELAVELRHKEVLRWYCQQLLRQNQRVVGTRLKKAFLVQDVLDSTFLW